ncbi:P-loop NTPase fold protein [Cohnella boryungensis]|uniref:P-loop NTPase fold protein n=1 Tax=Cohnella boryungensis TaxID=768479 RepID=A0ABV8SD45_9BACL
MRAADGKLEEKYARSLERQKEYNEKRFLLDEELQAWENVKQQKLKEEKESKSFFLEQQASKLDEEENGPLKMAIDQLGKDGSADRKPFFYYMKEILFVLVFVVSLTTGLLALRFYTSPVADWLTAYKAFTYVAWIGYLLLAIIVILFYCALGVRKKGNNPPLFELSSDRLVLIVSISIIGSHGLDRRLVDLWTISENPHIGSWMALFSFYASVFALVYLFVAIAIAFVRGNEGKDPVPAAINSDRPISDWTEDLLSRREFAEHIARFICRRGEDSLTVGLFGEWGSGKSSIFNMTKGLIPEKNTIAFEFKPWYFGVNTHDIIHKFLLQFLEEVQADKQRNVQLNKLLRKYIHALASVSLRPPGAVISVKDFLDKSFADVDSLSVNSLKKEIDACLKKLDKKIVVFIDDIDRLDSQEIQMVFKVVRLVADFPNTIYILAMDEQVIVDALGASFYKELSIGKEESRKLGQKYLEKFIQVPLFLPKADYQAVAKLCWNGLQRTLEEVNSKILDDTGAPKAEEFVYQATFLKLTPRNVKRYLNLVEVFVPMMEDKVNARDLLYLLLIKVTSPSLYEHIYYHKILFFNEFKEPNSDQNAYNSLINAIPDIAAYSNILVELFPQTTSMFSDRKRTDQNKEHWEKQRRICSDKHFAEYYTYAINDSVTKQDIEKYVSSLSGSVDKKAHISAYSRLLERASAFELNQMIFERVASDDSVRIKINYMDVLISRYSALFDKRNEKETSLEKYFTLKAIMDIALYVKKRIPETLLFYDTTANGTLGVIANLYDRYHEVEDMPDLAKMFLDRIEGCKTLEHFIDNIFIDDSLLIFEVWTQIDPVSKDRILDKWLGNIDQLEQMIDLTYEFNYDLTTPIEKQDEKSILYPLYPTLKHLPLGSVKRIIGSHDKSLSSNYINRFIEVYSNLDTHLHRYFQKLYEEAKVNNTNVFKTDAIINYVDLVKRKGFEAGWNKSLELISEIERYHSE